jgi:chaperonin GroEL
VAKKQLAYGSEARSNLHAGIDTLAHAVSAAFGPRGGHVALARTLPRVLITQDGARVAREIELPGAYANMGARLLKEAAAKTKSAAGDGSTTAIILACAMIGEGLKQVAAGANPIFLKRGMDKAAALAAQAIRQMTIPVRDHSDLAAVATTCTGDPILGEFVGNVIRNVTYDGVVTISDARGFGLEVEYADGYRLDRGYLSPHFVTTPKTAQVVITDPYILVTNQRVSSADEIMPVLRSLTATGKRDLVIIAEEVVGAALTILVVNAQKGNLNCLAVKGPEFGDQYLPSLEDLALATGARLIAAEQGREFRSATIQDMGRASKVVSTREYTVVVKPAGAAETIAARVGQIKDQVALAPDLYAKNRLEQRIARLIGQMALVRIGAETPALRLERRRQCQAAVDAAKAALEHGIVPGGGVAFLNAVPALDNLPGESDDEAAGIAIVRRALEAPMRQIAENLAHEGAVVVETVRRLQSQFANPSIGYDAVSEDYADMIARGIVDTAKMSYVAIENAASIAGMVLTIESLVTDAD